MATALVVLHMQNGVVEPLGDTAIAALDRCRTAVEAARSHGLHVVFVRLAFRAGRPEVQPRHRANPYMAAFEEPADSALLHGALAAEPDDFDVVNKRASAFKGSDLQVLLRSLDCGHLVISGIGTSGVVLATVIEAADLDYEVTVLSDACADPDDEVHRVLCEKVFPVRADVVSVDQWAATLRV